MGKLVEGLWDCKYCGTKGNRGSVRNCQSCGKPRDENTKFYMPGTITYVSEEKAETINRKPDWICSYCNSLNSDSLSKCKSCGSERNQENLDYFTVREQNNDNNASTRKDDDTDESLFDDESRFGFVQTEVPKRGFLRNFFKNYWKSIIAITLILALIAGMIYLVIPKNEEITITNFKWQRSIEIERYQTVNESGWFLPTGARIQYTRTEISHYESVLDHYETRTRQVARQRISGYETYVSGYTDLGNGYFEENTSQRPIYQTYYETETYQEPVYRDEPVYATKYYYEIDKWLHERTVSTSAQNQKPYWGDVKLGDDERISYKTERYYIIGVNPKGKERTVSLEHNIWSELYIGQTVKLKVSIFGDGEIIE